MSQPEKYVHIETTVGAHESVTLNQLPYAAGQPVEVTISPIATPTATAGRILVKPTLKM